MGCVRFDSLDLLYLTFSSSASATSPTAGVFNTSIITSQVNGLGSSFSQIESTWKNDSRHGRVFPAASA